MGQGHSTHPIHSAGRTGDVCVVRRYLNNPAILNRRDADDMTCLHWAAQLGHIDIIQEVIRAKARLDAQDVNGWTPLMHASCRGHKLAVGALLAAGASVDMESHDGRTALHRAATWKRLGPLDQLIEAGGNVRHEAINKWTPLHCAAAAGDPHGCAILMEAGADADVEDICGLKPIDVVADLSATEHITQVLAQGRRGSSPARMPRPSSTLLSSSDDTPANAGVAMSERSPARPSRAVDSDAGPLEPAIVVRTVASNSIDQKQNLQIVKDVNSSPASWVAEAATFSNTRRFNRSTSGADETAPKLGGWSRPTLTPSRSGGYIGGNDGGCGGVISPIVSPVCAPKSRSKKVVAIVDEEESEGNACEMAGKIHGNDRGVVTNGAL